MRWYARGSQCPACVTEFWTHERLICHLEEKSTRCRTVVRTALDRMAPEEFEAEEATAKAQVHAITKTGRRRGAAELRASRASGPLMELAINSGIDHRTRLHGTTQV
eukprot:5065522-Karenia_brevis.AAC.1